MFTGQNGEVADDVSDLVYNLQRSATLILHSIMFIAVLFTCVFL